MRVLRKKKVTKIFNETRNVGRNVYRTLNQMYSYMPKAFLEVPDNKKKVQGCYMPVFMYKN